MNDTVIMNDGQRMIVVSGPNPCFKNTEESFKTALFLSSPGPHAVLMALDPESEQCDLLKHLHESLGSEVVRYCIVLLLQQQQHREKAEDITAGKARKMINTCGGRFHRITDPRPALIAEINKLLWLNEGTFYSLEIFKTLQDTEQTHIDEDAVEEVRLFTVICQTLGGTTAVVGLSLMLLIIVLVGIQFGNLLRFLSGFVVLIAFEVTSRNCLRPEVSIPLNLALSSSILTVVIMSKREFREYIIITIFVTLPLMIEPLSQDRFNISRAMLFCFVLHFIRDILFLVCLNTAVGVFSSIRSWSDVIIVCYTAFGITVSNITMSFLIYRNFCILKDRGPLVLVFGLFLWCMAAGTLSIGFVTAFSLFDIKITITLYILGFSMAYFYFKS
ncbi:uncharacterized protein [Paramisgurnus dabryanus]|uniref:uncharacterized protein n=1 Tax=Paramisgurnus dabryanus TaxID=90735 RepID=UPI003CCF6124